MILLLCALLVSAASAGADVYFEEEVVNRGFGKDKTGARKTTNKIYIKGMSQRVEQLIEADAKTAKALRQQASLSIPAPFCGWTKRKCTKST